MAKAKLIEKEITKIVYEFKDKKKLILKGKELDKYILICHFYCCLNNSRSKNTRKITCYKKWV